MIQILKTRGHVPLEEGTQAKKALVTLRGCTERDKEMGAFTDSWGPWVLEKDSSARKKGRKGNPEILCFGTEIATIEGNPETTKFHLERSKKENDYEAATKCQGRGGTGCDYYGAPAVKKEGAGAS